MIAGDLTTLANCEAYIPTYKSDSGGPADTLLSRLITGASVFIANYVDRDQMSLGGQGYGIIASVSADAGGPFIAFSAPLGQVPPVGSVVTDLTAGASSVVATPIGPAVNTASKVYLQATTGFVANHPAQAQFLPTYNDTYNGRDTNQFPLRQWPIAAVSAVSLYGVTVPASNGPAAVGYQSDDRFLYYIFGRFCRGLRNIAVTYMAGYPSVPFDLEQASIDLMGKKFQERQHIDQTSQGVMENRISFSQKDMSENTRTVLQRYERELAAWS